MSDDVQNNNHFPLSLNLRLKDWAVFYAKETITTSISLNTDEFMERVEKIYAFLVRNDDNARSTGGIGYQASDMPRRGNLRHPQGEEEARPISIPENQQTGERGLAAPIRFQDTLQQF